MSILRTFKNSLFNSPYRALPWAVFVYFALSFLLHPHSPLYTGRLDDPDDYMRLVQVTNWLSGQGWHDLSQPRLSPGAHTVIHWARLVDLPLAAPTLLFRPWFGLQGGALLASMFVPPALFIVALKLAQGIAAPFVGKSRAAVACVLLLFAPVVVYNFTPGRAGHHGYQILIAGFCLFSLDGILHEARGWRLAIAAAIACAAGLWIGTEALPWVLLFIACLALGAVWQGGLALRNAAMFGGAFFAAMLAIVPLALPVAEWPSRALSWFSSADVIFAALVAAVFGSLFLLQKFLSKPSHLFACLCVLGAGASGLLLWLVPDILHGPFADYENFNATIALDNIGEALPLIKALHVHALSTFTNFLLLPLIAAGALVFFAITSRSRRELGLYAGYGLYISVALALSVFWQERVMYFLQLFCLPPLTKLLWLAWDKIAAQYRGRPQFWAEIAVFILLGPLPILLLPALYYRMQLYPDILLFPAHRILPSCDLRPVSNLLDWKYADHPRVVLTGMNEGPELLFTTPHAVIGGNFNVTGNQDVYDFFRSRDDAQAEAIAQKWHADLILTCRKISPFYAGLEHIELGKTAFLTKDTQGNLRLASSLDRRTLIERLISGQIPDWLKPVEIPGNSDYLLFEVKKSQ